MNHRIRIGLRPRQDLTFRVAFERACVAASLTGAELDTAEAARIVEEELRSGGYPNAEIERLPLCRGVSKPRFELGGVARWPPAEERKEHA